MNDRSIVKIENDYFLESCDGEHIVYHPTSKISLYLNDTGAIIWQLCDGNRSMAEIIEVLTELYPESHQDIRQGVRDLIMKLVDKKIAVLV